MYIPRLTIYEHIYYGNNIFDTTKGMWAMWQLRATIENTNFKIRDVSKAVIISMW